MTAAQTALAYAAIMSAADEEPIQTAFVYPPIPERWADWAAWRDEERCVGRGATEAAAIDALLQAEDDYEDARL